MHRLTLQVAVALITFGLGVLFSAVWVVPRSSLAERTEEARPPQSSHASRIALPVIPTVAFCDLLARPADYNGKVIRTQADLFSTYADLTISDPASCVLPHPMIGLVLDRSFQYDPDDEAQKEVYELLRAQGERKYGRTRVVIVGKFEGLIFAKDAHRSKYPHWFTIRRLEKAERVTPQKNSTLIRF